MHQTDDSLYREMNLTLPHQEAEVSFLKKGSIWKKGHAPCYLR